MSKNSMKGENFWTNFLLGSIIALEFVFFSVPDKMIVLFITLAYLIVFVLIKFSIEMKFYRELSGVSFLIGRTYWSKKLREETDYPIQKKIKYESSESLNLLSHPKIEKNEELKDKVKSLFKRENTSAALSISESVDFKIENCLYECKLYKPGEYELFVKDDEYEIVEFDRIFLLLPDEWDSCFDFGETDWIYNFYSVKINAAYVILECQGWVLGKYPLLKLRFSDKVVAEELDLFFQNYTEHNQARELILSKVIKIQESELIIFTEKEERLEIEKGVLSIENAKLKLKLDNLKHKPVSERLDQKFTIPPWLAYTLIIWTLISFVILGVLI